MPCISVVIPTYNRASLVVRAINNVLLQTFKDLEVIVVDDLSMDGTVDAIKAVKDYRVRLSVLDKNSGAQAARNRGIHEAKSKWIAFQDSDDEWLPNKLEKQAQALESVGFDPMTVVHTDCWLYESASGERTLLGIPLMDGLDVYPGLLTSSGPMFQGMLTSKAALEAIGLLDENVPSYQEWDTAIRLAKICRFVHLREPLFTYHLHEGETISKNRQRDIDGYQYIVDKFKDDIITLCGEDIYNSHLINNAFKAIHWGFRAAALEIFLRGRTRGMRLLAFLCRRGASERQISLAFYALKRMRLL